MWRSIRIETDSVMGARPTLSEADKGVERRAIDRQRKPALSRRQATKQAANKFHTKDVTPIGTKGNKARLSPKLGD